MILTIPAIFSGQQAQISQWAALFFIYFFLLGIALTNNDQFVTVFINLHLKYSYSLLI